MTAVKSDANPLVSVIVLTRDEELNLPICVASLCTLDCEVFVVDSGSTDRTVAIAGQLGARVIEHEFENQARQINWALETLPLRGRWTMRLDADERLTPELAAELCVALPVAGPEISAYEIRRRVYFWGRWIRHGGYYPTWLLRVWRTGTARCEDLWMDEHMAVSEGRVGRLTYDLIDENHKGLAFWVDKHNRFSDREVKSILLPASTPAGGIGRQAVRRRFLKNSVYGRAPLFVRALLYWGYRYFLRLGFLDGKPGFVFHFLQALWYRMVVDAKLYENERGAATACLGQAAEAGDAVEARRRSFRG